MSTKYDLEYIFDTYPELENIQITSDAYGYIIEECLILHGVDITRSPSYKKANGNAVTNREQATIQLGSSWYPPSEQFDKSSISSLVIDLIKQSPEGTRRIPFTSELTKLVGAPGLIHVRNEHRDWRGTQIFVDGKIKRYLTVADLEKEYNERAAKKPAAKMTAVKKSANDESSDSDVSYEED